MARPAMFTGPFWIAASERAVRTAAQASLALLTADGVVSIVDIDLKAGAGVVGLATAASLLMSVALAGVGPVGPSAANEVLAPPAPKIEEN